MHGGAGCRKVFGRARPELTLYNPFPPTSQALTDPNGLLATGGDLQPATLLCAYSQGIFPWFESDDEILWWSPDPRLVLRSDQIHISRSLKKVARRSGWGLRYDAVFPDVMTHCARADRGDGEPGTWITRNMLQAYIELHELGVAHSIEVLDGERLIGGLYGLLLDKVFFGESMFSLEPNASKIAFVALSRLCRDHGIEIIDCQVYNPHLESLGAHLMSRQDFENHLRGAIKTPMSSILPNPLCLLPSRSQGLDSRLGGKLIHSVAELV